MRKFSIPTSQMLRRHFTSKPPDFLQNHEKLISVLSRKQSTIVDSHHHQDDSSNTDNIYSSENSNQRRNKVYTPSGSFTNNDNNNTTGRYQYHPSYHHQQDIQQRRQEQQQKNKRDEMENQVKQIQKDMHDARIKNNLNAIFAIMKDAMNHEIPLSTKAYLTFLWACSQGEGFDIDTVTADRAFWVLKHMMYNDDRAPLEAYELVLKMCANRQLTRDAMIVLRSMKAKFGYISLNAIRTTLPLLCHQKFDMLQDLKTRIPHQHHLKENVASWVNELHSEFRLRLMEPYTQSLLNNNSTENNNEWTFEIYECLALHYSSGRRSIADTLAVLKEMTDAGHSPTFTMNQRLLFVALTMRDVELTTLLATWFLNGYVLLPDDTTTAITGANNDDATSTTTGDDKLWRKKTPKNILEYTLLRKILQLALVNRDTNLSTIGLQLFFKFNKVPAPMDYAHCARAFMQAGDILGALDVFFAAEEKGVDFLYHYNTSKRAYIPASKSSGTVTTGNKSSLSSAAVVVVDGEATTTANATSDFTASAPSTTNQSAADEATVTETENEEVVTPEETEQRKLYQQLLQQQAIEEGNEIEPNRDGQRFKGKQQRGVVVNNCNNSNSGNVLNNPEPKLLSSSLGKQLQIDLIDCFGASLRRLDEVYYALVDLAASGRRVPLVVLHALIMALGRLAQRDRAFATFQEFESVFHRVPVLHSYNALLFSIAYDKYPTIQRMLPVMQLMEENGYSPNSDSFSLLLTVMAETEDLDSFDAIADHFDTHRIQPTSKSLRRIALAFARQHNWTQVDRVVSILKRVPSLSDESENEDGDIPLPIYFMKRLDYFRHQTELKNQQQITANVVDTNFVDMVSSSSIVPVSETENSTCSDNSTNDNIITDDSNGDSNNSAEKNSVSGGDSKTDSSDDKSCN